MDTKNLSLRNTDTKKVESYLLDLLRGTSSNPAMTAYAVSYVIVKSSQVDDGDLSTIDSFILSCDIGKDIEIFLRRTLQDCWEYISKATAAMAACFGNIVGSRRSAALRRGISFSPLIAILWETSKWRVR